MDLGGHNKWIGEIQKYINEYSDENIVKLALSYTLQSLRNGEDIRRFQWRYCDDRDCE